MPGPVIVTAEFHPLPGRSPGVLEAIHAAIPAVHEEDGCILYAINTGENGALFMIEKWRDAESLAAHAAGEPVRKLNESLEGLVSAPATVLTFAPSPAGQDGKGAL
jgi:quinol monooxygenase YgiN